MKREIFVNLAVRDLDGHHWEVLAMEAKVA